MTIRSEAGWLTHSMLDSALVVLALLPAAVAQTYILSSNLNCYVDSTQNNVCHDIHCPTVDLGQTCFVVGEGGFIMKTADGGFTWTQQTSGVGSPSTANGLFYGVDCGADTQVCYIAGQEGVIRTTDGGTSWTDFETGTTGFALESIHCTSNIKCMAVGAKTLGSSTGKMIYTTDGINWNEHADLANALKDIFCQSGSVCYMVGVAGFMAYTPDFGISMNYRTSGTAQTLYGIDWPTGTTGYAVGAGGTVVKSVDSGANWVVLNLGITNTLRAVSFYSNLLQGFIVGDSIVLATTDGGTTWTNIGGTGSMYKAVDMKNWAYGATNNNYYSVMVGEYLFASALYNAPTRRRRVGPVYGDPITYYKGKKTEFMLPMGELTPMLETPDMHVFASPLPGQDVGNEQWIGSISVTTPTGSLVVQVDIKRDIAERMAASTGAENMSFDTWETLDVRMAPRGSPPIKLVPPADQYYTHPGGLHVLFGRTRKQAKDVPRREGVVVHGAYAKLHVMSTSAWEYYGKSSLAYTYAHLDFEIFDMHKQETFGGLLSELWGIKPMSEDTMGLIKPSKDEDDEILE